MPALTSNQNYKVLIRRGDGIQVQANAQTKLQLRIENKWVNILEALGFSGDGANILGKIVASAANTFQIFSGNNFLPEIATAHVWRGSNGLELELGLRFDAWDDPAKDVLKPVQDLIRLFMPTRGDGTVNFTDASGGSVGNIKYGQYFLHPPGPTPWEYLQGDFKHLTTITLGKVMIIEKLIPTSFSWEFEWRSTEQGDPIAANVTVGFMNYTLPQAEDVLGMFLNRQSASPTPSNPIEVPVY